MQGHACDLRAEEFHGSERADAILALSCDSRQEFHGSERADAILAFLLCSAEACPGLACMA